MKSAQNSGKTVNGRPFKPGQSGNPGGRPKTKELREIILADFKKDPQGNVARLKKERIDLYFAYAFGKPVEQVEISGKDGQQLFPPEIIAAAAGLAKTL